MGVSCHFHIIIVDINPLPYDNNFGHAKFKK